MKAYATVGQVRLYENSGYFMKYFVLSYSLRAGVDDPHAVVLVLDTNMPGKVFPGAQLEYVSNAALFSLSKEVEL